MAMEIFGHEFWSADGKTIWYDLQTPRGEDFWLAGYNVDTGERTWYHLQRDEWSIHFNVSRDGKLFCGDGGDPARCARQERPVDLPLPPRADSRSRVADIDGFVQPGVLRAEKLVNMSKHNTGWSRTSASRRIRSGWCSAPTCSGRTYVFAVEVAKSGSGTASSSN